MRKGWKLNFDAYCTALHSGWSINAWSRRIGAYSAKNGNTSHGTDNLKYGTYPHPDSVRKIYTILIGETGNYYIETAGVGTVYIYNIWLDK